jgi:hypothetical protein
MSLQNLILNNIEIMGYNHQNNFFGENSLQYSATRTLSIQGFVLDLQNSAGVKNVLNTTTAIKNIVQNFHNIIINGKNFGIGKFTSLSFDEGNWVRQTKFNADIEINVETSLINLPEELMDPGINLNNRRFDLIKNLSESFSVNFDTNNKNVEGKHTIDIEYKADNKDINVINLAQRLALNLLNNTLPSSLSELNYTNRAQNSYTILNEESYDVINGKCSFTKTFSYNTENSNDPYSLQLNHSISIDENGICTVEENCEIKAEYNIPSLYDNALKGLKNQLETSNPYDRINTFFNVYKQKFSLQENLNSHFIEKSIQINKFDGIITYKLSWDNDPKKKNPLYSWEYTQTLDRNEEGIWNVSENGQIIGFGKYKEINNEKYNNANSGWVNAQNNIDTRLFNFYNNNAKIKISGGLLKLSQKNINRSPYKGEISYNYEKTDDPRIRENDPNYIKRLNIEKSDTGLLPIVKDFIIPGGAKKYAVLQNAGLQKQGTYSARIEMSIGCQPNNQRFNGKTYFDLIKNNKSAYQINFASTTPGATDSYIESVDFSSDEIEKNISFGINYKYS